MRTFWSSIERLTGWRLAVLWIGIGVTVIGGFVPTARSLFWLGLLIFVTGTLLEHRAEHLKKLDATPRQLTPAQRVELLRRLSDAPKEPLTIGYFGQDEEAEQFAHQLEDVFKEAGYQIKEFSGLIVVKPATGIVITVFSRDDSVINAQTIQRALSVCDANVVIERDTNCTEPNIRVNVHRKPIRHSLRNSNL